MRCTWKDCTQPAKHPQVGSDGRERANLCDEHAAKLEAAVSSTDARQLVGTWARAGSQHPERQRLAVDMAKGAGAIVEFFGKWRKH
jgi:hypothetical protein